MNKYTDKITIYNTIAERKIPCVLIDFVPLLIFSSISRHSFRVHAVASHNVFRPIPFAVSSRIILPVSPATLISPRVYHYLLFRVS